VKRPRRTIAELERRFLSSEPTTTLEEHFGCEVSVGPSEPPARAGAVPIPDIEEVEVPPADDEPIKEPSARVAEIQQRAAELKAIDPSLLLEPHVGETADAPFNKAPLCEDFVRLILRTCCFTLKLNPGLVQRAKVWGSEGRKYHQDRYPQEEYIVLRAYGGDGLIFTAKGGAGWMLVVSPTKVDEGKKYTMNYHAIDTVHLVNHVVLIGNVSSEPQPFLDGHILWTMPMKPTPHPDPANRRAWNPDWE
jgi:hypothetical protein